MENLLGLFDGSNEEKPDNFFDGSNEGKHDDSLDGYNDVFTVGL